MKRVPLGYLRDDGVCAIDVRLQGGLRENTSANSAPADSLLRRCVNASGSSGRSLIACKSGSFL